MTVEEKYWHLADRERDRLTDRWLLERETVERKTKNTHEYSYLTADNLRYRRHRERWEYIEGVNYDRPRWS